MGSCSQNALQRTFFRDGWNIPSFPRQTKHKQMLTSKETHQPIHKSGKSPTILSSPQWNTPQNKLAYSWGKKKPKGGEGMQFRAVHTGVTYPTIWSPSAPRCWFLASVARYWGSQGHLREYWRSDPQDRWSWQLQGSWLASPKFVTELKLILLTAQQTDNW